MNIQKTILALASFLTLTSYNASASLNTKDNGKTNLSKTEIIRLIRKLMNAGVLVHTADGQAIIVDPKLLEGLSDPYSFESIDLNNAEEKNPVLAQTKPGM